jgi:hypothetical protein
MAEVRPVRAHLGNVLLWMSSVRNWNDPVAGIGAHGPVQQKRMADIRIVGLSKVSLPTLLLLHAFQEGTGLHCSISATALAMFGIRRYGNFVIPDGRAPDSHSQ